MILKNWISKKSHLLGFPLSYPEPQPGEERSEETKVTSFLVESRSTDNSFSSLFVSDINCCCTFDKIHDIRVLVRSINQSIKEYIWKFCLFRFFFFCKIDG